MLTKSPTKQNQSPTSQRPRRLWTATSLGRKIMRAEREVLHSQLGYYSNLTILELAPLEVPMTGLSHSIALQAASSSWQQPLVANLETLPMISRSADIVVWRYLGLEWRVRRRLLAEVVRVLVPGGRLITATLNPFDAAVWRFAGVANISSQAGAGIHAGARTLGLQVLQHGWYGSGWWRFRPLQISVLCKKTLTFGLTSSKHRRRAVTAPATALSRSSLP